MRMIRPEQLKHLRETYPTGTRVELVQMDDAQAPPIGTKGTVTGVDDTGSLLVDWDNGSGLNVIWGVDVVRKVPSMTDTIREQILAIRDTGLTNMAGQRPRLLRTGLLPRRTPQGVRALHHDRRGRITASSQKSQTALLVVVKKPLKGIPSSGRCMCLLSFWFVFDLNIRDCSWHLILLRFIFMSRIRLHLLTTGT